MTFSEFKLRITKKKQQKKNSTYQKTTLFHDMSGELNCKRNVCKRQENKCRRYNGEFDCKANNWKENDCKENDWETYEWENNWNEGGCGNKWNEGGCGNWEYGCKEDEEQKAAKENYYNNAYNNSRCRDSDCKRAVNKHDKHGTNKHNVNKEFEDKHERRSRKERCDAENACNKEHASKNKKYLVDKLYIYEHCRVIDLNCCENDRASNRARKDFSDLECAAKDFKEHDVSVNDFCDQNRRDLEAYEAARNRTRDLQNHHKKSNNSYVWSD